MALTVYCCTITLTSTLSLRYFSISKDPGAISGVIATKNEYHCSRIPYSIVAGPWQAGISLRRIVGLSRSTGGLASTCLVIWMAQIAVAPVDGQPPPCPSSPMSPVSATADHHCGGADRSSEASSATRTWMYELRPSHELPVVDLSVSIKSRFLGPRMLAAFTKVVSFRRTLFAAAVFSLLSYPVSLAITPRVGRPLAVMSMVAGVPVVFAGASLLRYEVVKLLLSTHDTLFFLGMAVTTLASVGVLLQDACIGTLVTTLIGLLPNIFVDANLRAVRRLTLITGVEVLAMVLIMLELMLDAIPDAHTNAAIASYGVHVLPAKMYASNGVATLIVLLLRNFFRKREAVFQRGNPSLQHCVTYRVRLKLSAVDTRYTCASSNYTQSVNTVAAAGKATNGATDAGATAERWLTPSDVHDGDAEAAYVQRLRYSRTHRVIDARNTVVPAAFVYVAQPAASASIARLQWMVFALFRGLTAAALGASVIALPVDRWLLANGSAPTAQCYALMLTVAHCGSVMMLSQRDLLRAVVSSFDFGYLSAHIVLLSLCVCDFFRWGQHSIVVFIVCLWLHSLMSVDALTPPIRERLGIQIRGMAVLLAVVSLGSTATIIYLLIFDPVASVGVFDRVIWTGKVPGAADVVLSIIPFFYSGLLTAFLLILRLLFRAATYANDDLVLIDGPVVFSNCFRRRNALVAVAAASTPRANAGSKSHYEERGPSSPRRGVSLEFAVAPIVPNAPPTASKMTRWASR